jgi:hypothetical protein
MDQLKAVKEISKQTKKTAYEAEGSIQSLMDDYGVSENEAEAAWDQAKQRVANQTDKSQDEFTDQDWGLVMTIAQNDLEDGEGSDNPPPEEVNVEAESLPCPECGTEVPVETEYCVNCETEVDLDVKSVDLEAERFKAQEQAILGGPEIARSGFSEVPFLEIPVMGAEATEIEQVMVFDDRVSIVVVYDLEDMDGAPPEGSMIRDEMNKALSNMWGYQIKEPENGTLTVAYDLPGDSREVF